MCQTALGCINGINTGFGFSEGIERKFRHLYLSFFTQHVMHSANALCVLLLVDALLIYGFTCQSRMIPHALNVQGQPFHLHLNYSKYLAQGTAETFICTHQCPGMCVVML